MCAIFFRLFALFAIVFEISLVVGIAYVAIHFITKFW